MSICRTSFARPACAGVPRVICCGHAKIVDKIARDGADSVQIETHRTLPPVLRELRGDGYRLVGLEQTSNSQSLHHFRFPRKMGSSWATSARA